MKYASVPGKILSKKQQTKKISVYCHIGGGEP